MCVGLAHKHRYVPEGQLLTKTRGSSARRFRSGKTASAWTSYAAPSPLYPADRPGDKTPQPHSPAPPLAAEGSSRLDARQLADLSTRRRRVLSIAGVFRCGRRAVAIPAICRGRCAPVLPGSRRRRGLTAAGLIRRACRRGVRPGAASRPVIGRPGGGCASCTWPRGVQTRAREGARAQPRRLVMVAPCPP